MVIVIILNFGGIMKHLIIIISAVLLLGTLPGCGAMVQSNDYMTVAKPEVAQTPTEGKALLIFERENNHVGSFHNMSIWDITDRTSVEFIGLLAPTMKASYSVKPGTYSFMAIHGGGRTIMHAGISANKTYYIMPSFGLSGLRFIPIKAGQDNPMTNKKIGVPNQTAITYSQKDATKNSVQIHISKGLVQWSALSNDEKYKRTIEPGDGR